jgi:hypothetical protein
VPVPKYVRAGWEHRFPGLSGRWTHWRIYGNQDVLAHVPGDRLADALDIVESNFGRYPTIQASRAYVHERNGGMVVEKNLHEISNYAKDTSCE